MSIEQEHAQKVYSTTSVKSVSASSPIAASWVRCMTQHKLAPEDKRVPWQLADYEFRQHRERSSLVIEEASEEMDRLFAATAQSGCCLLLTDENGVALDRRGAASDDAEFRGLGLWSGTIWSEASIGTNGIGTALADQRASVIKRDQHFYAHNTGLSCTAAPIRDERGLLAGAIDVSTCRDDAGDLVLSFLTQAVRDAAQRIEARIFRRAFPLARIIMVPNSPGGLLAVDRDDFVLGANRAARVSLRLDDDRIAMGLPAADALNEEDIPDVDLADAERAALRRALARNRGNVSKTAQSLGMSRATLHRKISKLGIA